MVDQENNEISDNPPQHEPVKIKDPHLLKLQNERLEQKEEIPNGYISIELTTKGQYGAPRLFHVRNFDTTDLVNLALSEDADLPLKVTNMLDSLILEQGVSVRDFHEKEVIETLVKIYRTFYSGTMRDVLYRPYDDDWEFLASRHGGADSAEFRSQKNAYEKGTWKPRFDINLDALDYYETPDDVKTTARIRKRDGFTVCFTYPKYGDIILLRDFIEKIFKEEDKKFASVENILKFRREMEEKIKQGENIAYTSLPNITDFDMKRYREHEVEKSMFAIQATKALHLSEFDGKDVSGLSLEERIELAKDPRLDYSTFNQVSKYFDDMKLGVKEEITVYNPIQEKVMKRNFTFQLVDILSAIRDCRPDGDAITFE